MDKQQIKKILEEEDDLDKAVEQILALDHPEKPKVESTVIKEQLEYEILSFKDKYSDRIMVRTDMKLTIFSYSSPSIRTIKFKSDDWYLTEYYLLKNPNWIIHSVKRLSDGVIFTIGDICNPKGYKKGINCHAINRFELIQGKILRINSVNWYLDINSLKKAEIKTPLFKTEDGVDIFDGDTYYCVTQSFNIQETVAKKGASSGKKYPGILDFSTREAAEDYVILNNPCLSVKELMGIYEDIHQYATFSEFNTRIKQLVKSKL